VLDLSRRKTVFHQDDVRDLDWPGLNSALSAANTASIDLHSLADRHHDARFFVSQVRTVLRGSTQPCALVVLTPPVAFESGEDLEPVSSEGLPSCPVVYVRYRGPMPQVLLPIGPSIEGRGRGPRGTGLPRHWPPPDVVDQLAATLKPLNPKILDVFTPEQMTRVFTELLKALDSRE
jgi:hypothetical protein